MAGKKRAPRAPKARDAASDEERDRASDEEGDALTGDVVDESEAPRAAPEASKDDEALDGDVIEAGPADGELEGEVVFEADPAPGKAAGLARRESGALGTTDPLQAYMRDVQRYSLLTPEETHDLAVKYVQSGDVDAAKKLVTSNLRLVVKIAFDYRRAYRNILDLVQEGNIGLMQAVKKYDPYRGVKLSSYAAWWIRAYILRFILNNWRLVKVGTTQAQRKLFFNLKKEKARLSAMGIDPTPERIAENLHVPTEEVIHMDRRLSAGEVSLDAPVGQSSEGKPTSRIESMPSGDAGADVQLAEGELSEMLSEKIHEFGRTLKGKEEIIFKERLMSEEPKTLQELGDQFGVSRERVRQLEKRLQNKIKAYLEAQVEKSALD